MVKILENKALNKNVYSLLLENKEPLRPGQFVNLSLEGFFLRRPFSLCENLDGAIRIVYKIAGRGTEKLIQMAEGEELDILLPLGNGFSIKKEEALLIGGGLGTAPLLALAQELKKRQVPFHILLGFASKEDSFLLEDFEKLGHEMKVATMDGSLGEKGSVLDFMEASSKYIYSCGPLPMLKALYHKMNKERGQFSLEARMGCGFGACMGCAIETKKGYKRICKEGPVFLKEEVLW